MVPHLYVNASQFLGCDDGYLVLMSRDRYGTPLLRSSLMTPCGSRPVTETA